VKPRPDEDPDYWVVRVDGAFLGNATTTHDDLSIVWYIATAPDQEVPLANFNQTYIWGEESTLNKKFYVNYNPSSDTQSAGYKDVHNKTIKYDDDYFYALTIDDEDQYDAYKYFNNELKDQVKTMPPHLFAAHDLYRAQTSMVGNLVA
jgi:hypothetical protein